MRKIDPPYDVVCPTCKRGVNEGCRTSRPESRGKPVASPHVARKKKSAKVSRTGLPNAELDAYLVTSRAGAGQSVELRLAEVREAAEKLGYVVTWWHPDEVGEGSDEELKDRAISAGNEYLAYVNGQG